MVSIPFSDNKSYLTGIDWLIHTFNYMTKQAAGTGFRSQVVLELDGSPDENEFRNCLDNFIRKFPVVNGRMSRGYNLAPYWKIPPPQHIRPCSLNVYWRNNKADAFKLLEESANAPFKSDRDHIAFHLIYSGGKKSYVTMAFDHRLFDARGAETFLSMLQLEWKKEGMGRPQASSLAQPHHLNKWLEKFKFGKQVNRTLFQAAENGPPRVLPICTASNKLSFKYKVIPFDEVQTAAIVDKAYDTAGYLLLMPYALSISIKALHNIFTSRSINNGDYIIPVSIDMRSQEKVQNEVFFNHVSFFLFRIQPYEAENFPLLLESIKQQMYDQVKSGLPNAFKQASLLMRIVPLSILNHLMRLYFKGEIASFCFSYVGDSTYTVPEFIGEKVRNIFHMPHVPIPPGLGVFFHKSLGKLHFVLSYADGILTDDEANRIVRDVKSRLKV